MASSMAVVPLPPRSRRFDAADEPQAPQQWIPLRGPPLILGVHKHEDAVALYEHAATEGIAAAQYHMGQACAIGSGTLPKDLTRAVQWWLRAASAGYAYAQLDLAAALWCGEGCVVDAHAAVRWWKEAANDRSCVFKAAKNLEHAYLYGGVGVTADAAEASQWAHTAEAARRERAEASTAAAVGHGGDLDTDHVET